MFRPYHTLSSRTAGPEMAARGETRGSETATGDTTADAAGDTGAKARKYASLEFLNACRTDPEVAGTL